MAAAWWIIKVGCCLLLLQPSGRKVTWRAACGDDRPLGGFEVWMIKKWWFLVIFDRSDWSSGRPRCNIVDGGASMRRRHLIGCSFAREARSCQQRERLCHAAARFRRALGHERRRCARGRMKVLGETRPATRLVPERRISGLSSLPAAVWRASET